MIDSMYSWQIKVAFGFPVHCKKKIITLSGRVKREKITTTIDNDTIDNNTKKTVCKYT